MRGLIRAIQFFIYLRAEVRRTIEIPQFRNTSRTFLLQESHGWSLAFVY